MADIILADCDGQIWVVGGEEHLDALLLNQLPAHMTVEVLRCDNRAMLNILWDTHSAESDENATPWALNPAITRRLLGQLGLSSGIVQFAPWSAMLDDAARHQITSAAAWAARHPDGRLMLRQFSAKADAAGLEDLRKLRAQLVAAALAEAGVSSERIGTDTAAAAEKADSERLRIVMEPVTA